MKHEHQEAYTQLWDSVKKAFGEFSRQTGIRPTHSFSTPCLLDEPIKTESDV